MLPPMNGLPLLYRDFDGEHEILVYDTTEQEGEKGRFRVMEFSNKAVQGAMDLDDPGRIVFEYPRAMIHLMEHNHPAFDRVFVIGHGIGTIAGRYPAERFKVAELSGKVVEASREYFGYAWDNVTIGDGRRILAEEPSQAYDYIILDAFNDKGTPRHLTSREFFALTREKLDPHGIVLLNVMGRGEKDRLVDALHTTLCAEYAFVKAFALSSGKGADLRNIIIAGSNRPFGYQARHMAGFTEIKPGQGHLILD